MAEEKGCPFCALDTEAHRVLYTGCEVVVALSDPRLMEGHCLVIPRRHVGALFNLPESAQREALSVALHFQKKLIEAFSSFWGKAAGCDLSVHTRPFMPRTELSIPEHAHIHLRPRFWKDPYYENVLCHETAMFKPLSVEERERFYALFAW